MNCSTSLGAIVNSPSGLFQSEAIFARNLFGAIPAEIVIPTRSFTFCLISLAIRVALPSRWSLLVTSKKASSRDKGSISEVYSWKT